VLFVAGTDDNVLLRPWRLRRCEAAFDSFTKGKIANETTMLGAATFVYHSNRENAILLKEFEQPGAGHLTAFSGQR
jgi:hypothetical protein